MKPCVAACGFLVACFRFIGCTTREFDWAWVCLGVICQCQQESGEFAWSCCITKLFVGDRKHRTCLFLSGFCDTR